MSSSSASALPLSRNPNKWRVIYPNYINSLKTRHEGRQISKADCAENPVITEIKEALDSLPVFKTKMECKSYSRDWLVPGRMRVLMNDDNGNPLHPEIKTRLQLYSFVGKFIRTLKKRHPQVEIIETTQGKMFTQMQSAEDAKAQGRKKVTK